MSSGKRPTVADLYPGIARIMLFAAFEEADSDSEPNYQQIIYTPYTEAVFTLDCSREECAGGGFDVTSMVDDMVKSGESRSQATLRCEGTLGSGGHRCGLKAEFRLIVD